MAMQQVEYEFPDPEKEKDLQEVEVSEKEPEAPELEIEGAVGRETIGKPKKDPTEVKVVEKEEIEVEVEDDTPKADRGRTPSEPPEEVTNEELESYSEKVKKRIQHFSKGYHDERRAKEEAFREREALENYTRSLIEENNQLKTKTDQSHNALIESAKKQVQSELTVAQEAYRKAHESGETDEMVKAQQL